MCKLSLALSSMPIFAAVVWASLMLASASGNVAMISLSGSEFDDMIKNNDNILINFNFDLGACRDCHKLSTELKKSVKAIESQCPNMMFADVNCSSEIDLCRKFGIKRNYPDIRLFSSQTEIRFFETFVADTISAFVKRHCGEPVTALATIEEVNAFVRDNRVSAIIFSDNATEIDNLAVIALELRANTSFAAAPNALLKSKMPAKSPDAASAILLFVDYTDEPIEFVGSSVTLESIKFFIDSTSFPLIDAISDDNYAGYVRRGLPIVWAFLEYSDDRNKSVSILREAAKSSKGLLSWVWLDANDHSNHAVNLGLDGKQWPAILIDNAPSKTKYRYPFEGTFEAASISAWSHQALAGNEPLLIKSERIPENENKGLIKTVGKTYDRIVLDESKDVLLTVHAPWCGHCKVLMPRLKCLAEIFTMDPSIVIAEINGDFNDVPIDYEDYPSIFLFPASAPSRYSTYDGDRSFFSISNFLISNATTLSPARKAALTELAQNTSCDQPRSSTTTTKDKAGVEESKQEL
uniref:protein disulfide-isomerase n=1 Tax=Spongospora subterranea TaxID=70186 RepID=A0A0H5QQM1_9EUKA|eukprot:CRZ03766.1 hypothetical protein [Spongospora subterranea]